MSLTFEWQSVLWRRVWMADGFRVLVSCPLVWDSIDDFKEVFDTHNIKVEIPDFGGWP